MKPQHERIVVAVDDDEINLMILVKGIRDAGYDVKSFASGEAAWEYMKANPHACDIALIDKMMPGLNGLELLRRVKMEDSLRHIPVILQTGDVGVDQMREGLENGAYYYLTKPFHPEILAAILHSAAGEVEVRECLLREMAVGHARFIALLREGEFAVKTHAEARLIAAALSQASDYPEFVALGLMELLANAIEHGNLEIGSERKRKCLLSGTWDQELAQRHAGAQYASRVVRVRMEREGECLSITIADGGHGFDWRQHVFTENAPGDLSAPNGRGIAKATIMLDDVRYGEKGNEVHCRIGLPAHIAHADELSTGFSTHS